jgi:hypothetical protein
VTKIGAWRNDKGDWILDRSADFLRRSVEDNLQRLGLDRMPIVNLRMRGREGIAKAKREGKYKGRKPTARAKSAEVMSLLTAGVRPTEVAKQLGIARRLIYRIKENYGRLICRTERLLPSWLRGAFGRFCRKGEGSCVRTRRPVLTW